MDLAKALLSSLESIWQVPFVVASQWWAAFAGGPWPHAAVPAPVHDEHAQLVVPEPLELDDEHGLFA
ncbi:hypothetical protein [Sphingobium aquiterrae]|uniref:hypothetical protein n=1 Tax=Sphingobium aquiterrae TaxID=2038656 RepID=UPI00301741E5